MSYLVIDQLTKSYQDKAILNGVSLSVEKGEFVSILGESGSGKTTMLKILSGLVDQDSGTIRLEDRDISLLPTQKREVSLVFQDYILFPHLNVLDNIAFSMKIKGVDSKTRRREALDYLEMMQLKGYERRMPHELSGGQKQRVAIARALAAKPKALLLDEPFSNLDANLSVEMCDFIKSLQRSTHMTTIMVTHDREEAMRISDRIMLLDKGISKQVGTPEEIYKKPNSVFTAGFMGGVNILKGMVEKGEFYSEIGSHTKVDKPNGSWVMLIRPEEVMLSPVETEGCCFGTVIEKNFLGEKTLFTIEVKDFKIEASVYGSAADYRPGQKVYLKLPKDNIKLVRD